MDRQDTTRETDASVNEDASSSSSPTDAPDGPLQDALHRVREQLELEVAFVSEFRDGRRIFRCVDAEPDVGLCDVGASDPLEDTLCQRVVEGRVPERLNDAGQHDVARQLSSVVRCPIGAHLSVPIRIDGEVFGTFCCFSRGADPRLNDRDLALVRTYAQLAERLLSRAIRAQRDGAERRARIRRTLEEERFSAVFQPIVHIGSGAVAGYEALTRFSAEPSRPPDQWFSEAAAVGLQAELEIATIRMALRSFHQLPDDSYLSLNVSPGTIVDGALDDAFAGLPLGRIVLEVTEHASVADYSVVSGRLSALRARGLRVAVDDAGAGYASFRHILRLDPEIIKLDASLVAAIDRSAKLRALAASVVEFARQTGSAVVAEGVENEDELRMLGELDIVHAQGYLLGRPMPLPPRAAPG